MSSLLEDKWGGCRMRFEQINQNFYYYFFKFIEIAMLMSRDLPSQPKSKGFPLRTNKMIFQDSPGVL